ncbi:MAG: hypothetical protein SP1CHLAM54_13180 [Chlamydiia bacterium]|nr:hypothetical protein [Chlamydiia bacterium]MCH9616214.1 hypothetical protein [Chlamydiia bacterium]MCH9629800.1 hypothetical protein [Chlamydiia bacterium]
MGYVIKNGNELNLSAPPQSGFRVGLDLECIRSFDALIAFTWFKTDTESDKTGPNMFPTYNVENKFNNPTFGMFNRAKCMWDIDLRYLTLDLGQSFNPTKWIWMRLFAGWIGLWEGQHFRVYYDNRSMRQSLDVKGIGMRQGFNSRWHMARGFHFVANTAFDEIWVRNKVSRVDGWTLNTVNDMRDIKPALESSFGLLWEQGNFMIQAMWEMLLFFNANQYLTLSEEANRGDLSFQGLTARATFLF